MAGAEEYEYETLLESVVTDIKSLPGLSRIGAAAKKVRDLTFSAGSAVGNVAWVVGTSALVLVMPLIFTLERETTIIAQEQAQQQAQQPLPNLGAATLPPLGAR